MVGFGASALIFQNLSNVLKASGSYTSSFITAAAGCVITLILIALLKVPKKVK
jgi:uncharacterized membrane protein YeaQ/YmgE (transglycosylase-associated protein family)